MKARFVNIVIVASLFLFLAGNGGYTWAENAGVANENILEKKTIDRYYDPIEIHAEVLKEVLGKKISEMQLYSFVDGSFRQVPFQFDEWTEEGSMILDLGREPNGELANGILDKQDMLVFMAREAGDRVSRDLWPGGVTQGIEIEIKDPLTDGKGWCYLLYFSEAAPKMSFGEVSTVDDTDMLIAEGKSYTVVGTNHTVRDKVYKTIVNEHVWINQEGGGDGKDFVDRSKFRVSASFFFGTIRIGFNEDDFIGEVTKYKLGPVRSVARQWFGVNMPFRLKSPKIYGDVYAYDTLILIGMQTNIPFNPKYVLTDFKMILGYDLHHPHGYGMMWYNSVNPEGFLADGVTSPMEAEHDDSFDKWRCIVGPNGWIVHRSMWDEFYFSQADIRVRYLDDVENRWPPEYYPGDLGYYSVESTMTSLKPRKYYYQLEWYWPYDFYDPNGVRMDIIEQIVNIRDHPLEIKVGSTQVVSSGGVTTLVDP